MSFSLGRRDEYGSDDDRLSVEAGTFSRRSNLYTAQKSKKVFYEGDLCMSIEVGVLIDMAGFPFYWHTPEGASSVQLPDSRTLWDEIWENRQKLRGFAHSHPGSGRPSPSSTDLTTFAAIEAGLGTRLTWWILSADSGISVYWSNKVGRYVEVPWLLDAHLLAPWVLELRRRSNFILTKI